VPRKSYIHIDLCRGAEGTFNVHRRSMTRLPCIILCIVEINKMNLSLYGSINGVKKK
jgi:hypothetical protein